MTSLHLGSILLTFLCGSLSLVALPTTPGSLQAMQPDKAPVSPPPPKPIPQWPENHGTPKPTGTPTQPSDKTDHPPTEYTTAEQLLVALESADQHLSTLTADITYDNIAGEIEGGDRQIRRGTVSFRNSKPPAPATPDALAPPPATPQPKPPTDSTTAALPPTKSPPAASKSFAVTFDTLRKDGKLTTEARSFILNDGVLVEKLANDKHINRYKLGGGAAKIDPLKIGEGPFPIPFGQKPADINARFTVELLSGLTDVPTTSDAAKKLFADTYQLRLIPKPDTKPAKEFSEARIWFTKKDLLPIMARTTKVGGGSDEFRLVNIKLNAPIDDSVFSTATPDGWTLEEKEMR